MTDSATPLASDSAVSDSTVSPSGPAPVAAADRDLVVLFSRSLRLLGDAGFPAAANRLAAKAWWALRDDDPKGANRISGVMHYLAKLPDEPVETDRSGSADDARPSLQTPTMEHSDG
jgi:hypothetical protein